MGFSRLPVAVVVLVCVNAKLGGGPAGASDAFDSLFEKHGGSPAKTTSHDKDVISLMHTNPDAIKPEDMTHEMLARMFKEQEQRKAKYLKAGDHTTFFW